MMEVQLQGFEKPIEVIDKLPKGSIVHALAYEVDNPNSFWYVGQFNGKILAERG